MIPNVDALIVTYNRLEKLKKCIDNLLHVDAIQNIFIINNHSTDDTQEFLNNLEINNKRIVVFNLEKNLGGAGGFNYGLKKYMLFGSSEYIWVMDDDTIPNVESLNKMLVEFIKVPSEKRGYVTGRVVWRDGKDALMNIPIRKDTSKTYSDQFLELESASFVGILFSKNAIYKVGYPILDFFIWGDDVEYTQRITKFGLLGIQVKDAIILHDMEKNSDTNILYENSNISRINRYFYDFRNRIYLSKKYGNVYKTLLGRVVWLIKILVYRNKYKMLKINILIKGTLAGLLFNPKVESYKQIISEYTIDEIRK